MQGLNDAQEDRTLGLTTGTTARWRYENDAPANYFYERARARYAVYLRKTDEPVCVGTAKECAAALAYKNPQSFYRVYNRYKVTGTGRYEIVRLEEEAQEDV